LLGKKEAVGNQKNYTAATNCPQSQVPKML
jgi:hypothetical protein